MSDEMNDKRKQTVKNRKDMTPDEFWAAQGKPNYKISGNIEKKGSGLKKFTKILSALGFFPVLSSKESDSRGNENSATYSKPNPPKKSSFREAQHFDIEKTYIKRMEEEAYINSLGYTKDDLILTEKEYIQRMQEDAYLDSLPGYRKKDSKRDDER